MVTLHKTEVSEMRGIGRQMPITMACFAIGSISIIGLPPLGGSWSKWFLLLGTVDADLLPLAGVLIVSSLLNIAYLMPVVANAFFIPRSEWDAAPGFKEAPLFCLVPLCLTAFGCLVLFFYADALYVLLQPVVTP